MLRPAAPSTVSTPGRRDARKAVSTGKEVFLAAGCGTCHILAVAKTGGTYGPNLDVSRPSKDLVVERVTWGKGAMPSFKGRLSAEQIQAVAAFVAGR